MTDKPEVNRHERIISHLPIIGESTFNSVNTCALSGTRTIIPDARNPLIGIKSTLQVVRCTLT
jgi:hypothetical protein